jgi:hypothetical protein
VRGGSSRAGGAAADLGGAAGISTAGYASGAGCDGIHDITIAVVHTPTHVIPSEARDLDLATRSLDRPMFI